VALAAVFAAGPAWGQETRPAEDWSCWRGPTRDGKSPLKGIRTDWSGGLRKVWEVTDLCVNLHEPTKAQTHGGPAIQGDRLVVPGRTEKNDVVFCFDARTGRPLWRSEYPTTGHLMYGYGARATPTIEGGRVYTFGAFGHLACWDLADGKQVWLTDVGADGGLRPVWGHASSPVIHEGLAIVKVGGPRKLFAYHKDTGKLAWKGLDIETAADNKETKSPAHGDDHYATPTLATIDGRRQVVALIDEGVLGVDAGTGQEIWRFLWENGSKSHMTGSTPLVDGSDVFVGSYWSKPAGGKLLHVNGGQAALTWWNKKMTLHHTDPILLDGWLYLYSDHSTSTGALGKSKGHLKCLEFKTGQEKWSTDEVGMGTMVTVDGYLLSMSNQGKLTLVAADPAAFRKVAEMQVFQTNPKKTMYSWTCPAVADGKVYLRYLNDLVCYDLKQ
jgi:outer membrane protein assembly factor BamB